MIILSSPKLEVRGFFVFLDDRLIEPNIYRYNDFDYLYPNLDKSLRVLFSYTPIKRAYPYEYGILCLSQNNGDDLAMFACHKANVIESLTLLYGEAHIYSFSYNKNDTTSIYEAKPKKGETYELKDFFVITNTGLFNSILLLKIKPPLLNTDEFKKNKGGPIILKANERITNYNYLVWNRNKLEPSNTNLLAELSKLLNNQ
jgi:hypothetical protein